MDEPRSRWQPDHSTQIPWGRFTVESFTTIELKINFFRPVWEAALKAEGKVVRRGNSFGYVECEITDDRGRLVAKAASTCLALRGEQARGR